MSFSTRDYEAIAEICSNRMLQLFPHKSFFRPPVPLAEWRKHLTSYISSILRRSELDISVAVAAMTLLFRYKDAIQESSERKRHDEDANRLFISAYMVASMEVCGVSYQVDYWMDVTKDRFWRGELEAMEGNFFRALHGDVQVDGSSFAWFKPEMDQYTRNHRTGGNESDHEDALEEYLSPPPDYEEVVRGRRSSSLFSLSSGSEFDESDEDVETLARIFRDSTSIISDADDTENILISKSKELISTCRKKISQMVSMNACF